ncbi:MAG: iron ABC transporter permease [Vagococcus sp.]|jgi:iron complex transport system permease protein|nr:iron ABC transporter permease [Vagococcus sp.]
MTKKISVHLLGISLFIFIFLLALSIGTIPLSFSDIFSILFFNGGSKQEQLILYSFRIPRVVVACLVGLSLSISGDILQKISRNHIADASISGISSGVALGGVFYYYILGTYQEQLSITNQFSLLLFGLTGAALAIFLNLLLSFQFKKLNMGRFILNGIGISSGFAALVTFFSLKINADDYSRINNWLNGSIAQMNWEKCFQMAVWILPVLVIVYLFYPKLILLKFQDSHLDSIGFPTTFWRLFFIFLAAILISISVLTAGTIGFVGLIVPALTRSILPKSSRHYFVLLCFNGMSVLVLCDLFSRTFFSPNELPLNAMMGILGVPYLIFLFYQSKQRGL